MNNNGKISAFGDELFERRRGVLRRLLFSLKRQIVQDVPNFIAACEFNCKVTECGEGRWATCKNRLVKVKNKQTAALPTDQVQMRVAAMQETTMAMMEWNDSLKVGHSLIDRDHERLVGLVNALRDAVSTGQVKDDCGKILDELARHTQAHFAFEEGLMSLHQYADTVQHKAEHARLVQELLEFRSKYQAGTVALSASVLHFLMKWLTHHIHESDKALAQEIPPG